MAHVIPLGHVSGRRRLGTAPELTGFVGRQAELAGITALLGGARLVTTVGPPGVGKTRLSLRAAAVAADRYPDGAWVVELSGLRDPLLVASTIAGCLGLPEQDARSQYAAVLGHLRERRLLLILDTCEHLIDACAAFAEAVLREAPQVTLLATSRQPLDVPGEHIYPVPPLPVPDPGSLDGAATAREPGDAVELFEQRAAAAVPGFAITAANRDDVIRLCRRLDGIPLAIELAAVRLRALPLPELADRLESGFQVLASGRRGTTARHQTLYTAVEWSYGLCTPAERALWARLSVFAGTFDMAAAEQVCAEAVMPRDAFVYTLIGLVDKSIVLRDHADETRYRLLDTLREFGAAKLAEAGQEAECRGRLIARCLAMARSFDEHFTDDDQAARYQELRREHANIRAALQYSLGRGGVHVADGAALAIELHCYWQMSGLLREGRHWLGKVIGLSGARSAERASALGIRGRLSTYQGDVSTALADIRQSIGLAADLGDRLASARGALYLNLALTFAGRQAEAMAAEAEARRLLTEIGHRAGLITLERQMAHLYLLAGDVGRAVDCCGRALRMLGGASRELWLTGYVYLLSGLALLQQPHREVECAIALRRALLAKHELGDVVGTGYALEALGWLSAAAGRAEQAAWLLGAVDSQWERIGVRPGNIAILAEFRQRAARQARDALGDRRYGAAHAQGAGHPLDLVVGRAIEGAGELLGRADPAAVAAARRLTKREQEIAAMVASGLSNREIADRLVISKRTVDAHVEHIFGKLEISSREQLTRWLHDQQGS